MEHLMAKGGETDGILPSLRSSTTHFDGNLIIHHKCQ